MLCFIHKWTISRKLDTGKPVSPLTQRHLGHCEACREFQRLGDETARRLEADAATFLKEARPALNDRVRRALNDPGRPDTAPSISRVTGLQLKPVLAAVALLAVLGVSLIWMVGSRPTGMPQLGPLLQLETGRANLVSALQRAESPYQQEILELKKTLQSTADYLAARFDTSLGKNSQ
jgi:predicted anti-sigma-YlaC factor YlaD